ncbi:MAG: DNA-binding domain-containing protein [Pseudomonadales bacterium]|nr:DNA-binding domain-containing protein [Pseudomonadales bacterium]
MINLREQQQLFLEAVFKGENSAASEQLSHLIVGTENMSAQQHINIYRDGVLGGLTQALSDTFPVCLALVGEQFFNAMAGRFIQQQASGSPDLGDYSPLFAGFIEKFEPAEQLFYLADVARLEWHWHQVFHERDDSRLDFEALSEVGEQDVTFRLVTAGRLMSSPWPIQKIWQVNQPGYQESASVDLDEDEVFLWIWRNSYEMRIDPVDADEWKLLNALAEHKPFSQVCDELAAEKIDLISLLPRFVEKGWICDFSVCGKE